MREPWESAEAVVARMSLERGTEQRAEEPRECNQPKGLDNRGGKDIDVRGHSNYGCFPSSGTAKPVDSGGTEPAMTESRNRRNKA